MSIFSNVSSKRMRSNVFDLSHDVKCTFNMGELVPTCLIEALPGDKFRIGTEQMIRFAPMVAPVMHVVNVSTHYFFVPNRILWDQWEDFIGGNPDDVVLPFVTIGDDVARGSVLDYMGVPINQNTGQTENIVAFPFAAFFAIYDEYYRDQHLIDGKFQKLNDGDNNAKYLTKINADPPKRAWNHDYFTSARPTPQADTEVTIPLVTGATDVTYKTGHGLTQTVRTTADAAADGTLRGASSPLGQLENTGGQPRVVDIEGTHEVDVQAEATNITTLRRALRLQEWLELAMRTGTRYKELLINFFDTFAGDARLDRPEYIGGSKGRVTISEVLSTAQTIDQSSNDIPIGQMAGHGIAVHGGNYSDYHVKEHGWIIGITSVMPITAYQDGLNRMWSRNDYLDYYWRQFAHIGEQAILNKEIQIRQTAGQLKDDVFGYAPRYSEYKYIPSRVAGYFRDDLSYWTLARVFEDAASPAALNEQFIECNPSHRIFAVTDPNEDKLYAHIFNNVRAIRKMPVFGNPMI